MLEASYGAALQAARPRLYLALQALLLLLPALLNMTATKVGVFVQIVMVIFALGCIIKYVHLVFFFFDRHFMIANKVF